MVYVTVNGQLADQGMVDTSMAPMSARDYVFRYEGLHGQLRKDNAYLVELAAAIERHAQRRHPQQYGSSPDSGRGLVIVWHSENNQKHLYR